MSKSYPLRYFAAILFVFLLAIFLACHSTSLIDGLIVFFGLSSVFLYLVCKKKKDYFDPMFLFSMYYVLVYASALMMSARGFENNLFISSTSFYHSIDFIYTLSLLICFLSYVFALAGYHCFLSGRSIAVPLGLQGVGGPLFFFLAAIFYLIGFSGFLYNVVEMYSGDVVSYFRNISIRHIDFAEGGTTLTYQFMYAGSYMLYVRMLQTNKRVLLTYSLVLLSILVFASSGRVTNTIFYLVSFLVIYYYNLGSFALNKRFFLIGVLVALSGLGFYALRYASSLYYNGMYDFSGGGVVSFLNDFFSVDTLAFFLVDKGNLPNLAVLMKVVDSWGTDVGYMFGSTLLYPFYGFLSSDFFGLLPMPSVTTKEVWYSDIPGGNLPVTGMGEMVLNFSVLGFPIGMFLFGAMAALFRNLLLKTRSNIYLIFYAKVSFFFFLYPKGEFNNLDFFWMAFPSLVFLISVYAIRSFSPKYT